MQNRVARPADGGKAIQNQFLKCSEIGYDASLGLSAHTSRTGPDGSSTAAQPSSALQDVEREHIVHVLRRVNGNRMAAAKLLGISRRALYRSLDRHHLTDLT